MSNMPTPKDSREAKYTVQVISTIAAVKGIIYTKLALLFQEPSVTAQTAIGGPENINAV